MKNEKSTSVVNCFKKLLKKIKFKPHYWQTDSGTCFTSRLTQQFFQENGIKHFVTYSETKASIVERSIREIRKYIQRYLTYNNTKRYLEILPLLEKKLNETTNRMTGFRPVDINKSNEHLVWHNLFYKDAMKEKEKPIYKIGEKVRISK